MTEHSTSNRTGAQSVGNESAHFVRRFFIGERARMQTVEREPVVIWTTVGALVSALLLRFVPDLGNDVVDAIVAAIVVLGPVIAGAVYARQKVTPTAAPKMEDGRPAALVPQEYWQQLVTRVQRDERHD